MYFLAQPAQVFCKAVEGPAPIELNIHPRTNTHGSITHPNLDSKWLLRAAVLGASLWSRELIPLSV